MAKKRNPAADLRGHREIRFDPAGYPTTDPDGGLTRIWVPKTAAAHTRALRDALDACPIARTAELARDRLRKVNAPAPDSLNGPEGIALKELAQQDLHTQDVLAAKTLHAALRCQEALARGDAREASRFAFFTAWHHQTRRGKQHERTILTKLDRDKRRRTVAAPKGGKVRAKNARERWAQRKQRVREIVRLDPLLDADGVVSKIRSEETDRFGVKPLETSTLKRRLAPLVHQIKATLTLVD